MLTKYNILKTIRVKLKASEIKTEHFLNIFEPANQAKDYNRIKIKNS